MKKVLDIPRELHIEILSNLDAVSLIQCAMTCKTFYSAYKTSSLLEYIVQLHLDGLKHTGTQITESYSECLQRLLRRRHARLSAKWTECQERGTQHFCEAYELVGGFFANTNGRNLEILDLMRASEDNTVDVTFIEGGPARFQEFSMDPSQDMVVWVVDVSPSPQTDWDDCTYHHQIY
ncbi:hypothetical protein BDN70DRAFT_998220 [Pholiota conissans]|uniref:F-box domain-containing protein n=1 Tax=Pholiota conissans TaxID=109636 RepID=A0A9P6CTP8_9AGAR|nr:hypothetical protein BDN70DRAFT_998220 [Pholiota conissans]